MVASTILKKAMKKKPKGTQTAGILEAGPGYTGVRTGGRTMDTTATIKLIYEMYAEGAITAAQRDLRLSQAKGFNK